MTFLRLPDPLSSASLVAWWPALALPCSKWLDFAGFLGHEEIDTQKFLAKASFHTDQIRIHFMPCNLAI